MIATLHESELLFLYVVTKAHVLFPFRVFLAFVPHSRVISLSDSVWGRLGRGGAFWRSRWDGYKCLLTSQVYKLTPSERKAVCITTYHTTYLAS